jgi:hypothetical protein
MLHLDVCTHSVCQSSAEVHGSCVLIVAGTSVDVCILGTRTGEVCPVEPWIVVFGGYGVAVIGVSVRGISGGFFDGMRGSNKPRRTV